METRESRVCQCHCVPQLSLGTVNVPSRSFKSWLKLTLKRILGNSTKRKLKRYTNNLMLRLRSSSVESPYLVTKVESEVVSLEAGDRVRVCSEEVIQATLNTWSELKGCMFMDAQRQYCDTIQRVLKPVERFVDERDYRVKKAKGLVLLEGIVCEGTPDYGRCDRTCFYFWREEWLEKIS